MTQLVAILNITPDSFSDGGVGDYATRIAQAIADGASVLDLGAESTRPGATLLTQEEEWERLESVLSLIAPASLASSAMSLSPSGTKGGGLLAAKATSHLPLATTLSIDTRHPETFRRALGLGAKWFNDVSGFQNPESVRLAAECGCDIVLMHSVTVPADPKQTLPEGSDVIAEILRWAEKRVAELTAAGIAREKIIFDPGIGFGKTAAQSWQIIERVSELKALGLRLLIGHSRKSFLNATPLPLREGTEGRGSAQAIPPTLPSPSRGEGLVWRDAKTAEISRALTAKGIDYLRVHNVKVNREALR